MKNINRVLKESSVKSGQVKILQFGEGNFLRGFVDEMIDEANERGFMDAEIIIVKPRNGSLPPHFMTQNNRYTTSLRGKEEVRNRIVSCVSKVYSCYEDYDSFMKLSCDSSLKFVVSNTTEAGIVFDFEDKYELEPPASFPGKLAKFLYERYKAFEGDRDKGVIILPVELIDDNGKALKKCIELLAEKWNLEEDFLAWLDESSVFCNTLVDRIISGYPRDEAEKLWKEWGYKDELIVTGEPFGLWVIESEKDISKELPLDKAGLPVIYTDNLKPYKKRKVRILNGAHTSFVPAAYLMGYDYVLEAVSDDVIEQFIVELLEQEVMPTLEMDKRELKKFAASVLTRFKNPYIKHELSAIALNSISKWKTRCLPTMQDYIDIYGLLPRRMIFSLAALLVYYRGSRDNQGRFFGYRDYRNCNGLKDTYEIRDDESVIEIFEKTAGLDIEEYAKTILSEERLWGVDLDDIIGVRNCVVEMMYMIIDDPKAAMRKIISK